MKKTILMLATIATIAVAVAPAEARGLQRHGFHPHFGGGRGAGVALLGAAVAATVAAGAYNYGPGYYYAPAPVYYVPVYGW